MNIYSITPINWVIIKQEGTNRIRQNNAPFLALQSFFSTATRYFPVIRPEQFSSPNGDHAHKKSPEEYTLPSRPPPRDPSFPHEWAYRFKIPSLDVDLVWQHVPLSEPFPVLRACPRPFFSTQRGMPSEFTLGFLGFYYMLPEITGKSWPFF